MDIKFQQLFEQNGNIKEIIIKLDAKVEELSKIRHDNGKQSQQKNHQHSMHQRSTHQWQR